MNWVILFRVISWVSIIGGGVVLLVPFVHWFCNPEFTSMQIFREYIEYEVIGMILVLGGYVFYPRK